MQMDRTNGVEELSDYCKWVSMHKFTDEGKLKYRPKFSIILPILSDNSFYEETIESVLAQTYRNYELIIIVDEAIDIVQKYNGEEKLIIENYSYNSLVEAYNHGINIASGDYLAFIVENDTLDKHALYEMAKKITGNRKLEFIYSDEDSISVDRCCVEKPLFKPNWSPDYFFCVCYTGNLALYKRDTVKRIGGFSDEFSGYYEYEFILRLLEVIGNDQIGHVHEILYHRSEKNNDLYLEESKYEKEIKENYIKRTGINASLKYVEDINAYRPVYENANKPKVSIIIPSKDNFEVLKNCIDSVIDITEYHNYEIVVVDNGSSPKNRSKIEEYLSGLSCVYCYGKYDFNYAKMCNLGVKKATGEYLLFLNDDIEVIQHDWMDIMLGHASQKHIGAVGAKLLYPDSNLIQHMGVYNTSNSPDHIFARRTDREIFYLGMNRVECNFLAVTGACLMVSSYNYNSIGGFDENLSVAFNDVDLCIRLLDEGLYNVVRQDVRLYHHESLSRGSDYTDSNKYLRLSREKQLLYYKHPELKNKDAFVNVNICGLTKQGVNLRYEVGVVEQIQECNLTSFCDAIIVSVEIDECIVVKGRLMTDKNDGDYFLLLEDPFMNRYRTKILYIDDDNKFEVYLDKALFRIDIVPYRYGVQIVEDNGLSREYWEDNPRNPMRNLVSRTSYSSWEEVHEFKGHYSDDVQYCLDEIRRDSSGIYIKGWGLIDGHNHYQYKKSIILLSKNDKAIEFEVREMERPDVAIIFPQYGFLCIAGVECWILPDLVKANIDYDIILRFTNVFDVSDVKDILLYSSSVK